MAGNCYNRDGNCEPDERCRCNDEKPERIKLEDILNGVQSKPEVKAVLTDDLKSCKDFECVNCDFTSNDREVAIKHNQETRHEMWVKRK